MTIEHLSYSTLSDYKECGEKVRLRKIEKIRSAPSWSLVGGSLVHQVTEALDFRDFGIEVDDRPFEFDKEAFDTIISLEEERSGVPSSEWRAAGRVSKEWPNKENYDWWLQNGPVMVANWRRFITGATYQVALFSDGPAIELDFEIQFGDAKVIGYIDRVIEHIPSGELIVLDLKSGSRDPMTDEQLGIYSLGLAKKGITTKWGTYFMVRKGTTTLNFDLSRFHDGRLDYEYESAWKAMQLGVFLPKVGQFCSSCGVRDFCRAVGGQHADQVKNYERNQA